MGGAVSGRTVRVVLLDERWAVVRSGDPEPLSVHDRRRDAVIAARAVASRDGGEVVVFSVGGRPLPPDAPDVTP
jgi:hypothetical protein